MASNTVNPEDFAQQLRRTLKEHWQRFLVQGIILVILGALAVAVPQIASIAVSAFVGWLLFLAGVARGVSLYKAPHAPGYGSSMLLAVLTAILGLVLALFPVQGAVTLTMLLVAYFVIHGIASFIFAFAVKQDTGRWVLIIFGGIIDFILAALVIAGWPSTAVWVLGLYVGINMLFSGFALTFAALGARSSA